MLHAVGFTVQQLAAPLPDAKPIVAYARTATIRAREPARDPKQHRANQLRWYEYVASGARPSVAVLQDLDGPFRGYGAFWGEVQTNIHQALGCVGTITDGAIRDNRFYSRRLPGALDWASFPTIPPNSGLVEHHPFPAEIDHFVECIRTGVESHVSLHDAVNTHEVCFAADQSGREGGRLIELPLRG